MSQKIWPTAQSVKKAINQNTFRFHTPRSYPLPVAAVQEIVIGIWNRLKPTHTRKQTIRIMNKMTMDELESECARYILERSEQ